MNGDVEGRICSPAHSPSGYEEYVKHMTKQVADKFSGRTIEERKGGAPRFDYGVKVEEVVREILTPEMWEKLS